MDDKSTYIYLVVATYFIPPSSETQRIAYKDGDIIIGAMLDIHERSGRIRDEGVIQAEVLMNTIDKFNKDNDILPDTTLGYEIMDTRGSYMDTMDHALNIIKDELIAKDLAEAKQDGVSVDGFEGCWMKPKTPISVLIGPDTSSATIGVQKLLQFLEVPQVGFSATSFQLDDKFVYDYFLRVVPSQRYQMNALVEMLQFFNWTYVSVVYTEGHAGHESYNLFEQAARSGGVCIAGMDVIRPHSISDDDGEQIIHNLARYSNAEVVICLCSQSTLRALVMAAHTAGRDKMQFIHVPSDNAMIDPSEWQDVIDMSPGLLSFGPHKTHVMGLAEHLAELRPEANKHNPWFREFASGKDRRAIIDAIKETDAASIIDAVTLVAHALNELSKAITLKDKTPMEYGTSLLNYLAMMEVQGVSGMVKFDNNGNYAGDMRYDLLNYTKLTLDTGNSAQKYGAVEIIRWIKDQNDEEGKVMIYPNPHQSAYDVIRGMFDVRSVCSLPCLSNEVKVFPGGDEKCCWLCTRCDENEIIVDNQSRCEVCPAGLRPNEQQTVCEDSSSGDLSG